MGSAPAAAKGSGWGIGAAIWASAIQTTENKRWCQAMKRLLKKHEGSQRKLQTRTYLILQYLQPSETYMLNIVKTVAFQKIRRSPPPPSRPKAQSHGGPRVLCVAVPRRWVSPPPLSRSLAAAYGLKPEYCRYPSSSPSRGRGPQPPPPLGGRGPWTRRARRLRRYHVRRDRGKSRPSPREV